MQFCPNSDVISKKKGVHRKIRSKLGDLQNKKVFTEIVMVFRSKLGDLQKIKEGLQASHADFSVSFRWDPLELMGPLLGRCGQRPS